MSTDIISIVESIPDRQPASLTVTDPTGNTIKLPCNFKESEAPGFFLLFSAGTIPENIGKDWRCALVSKDSNEETVTFSAKIVELLNNRVIELVAKKSIRPEDLREYFRVNIKAPVAIFYDPGTKGSDEQPLELKGETVDISQTGVLTMLSDDCRISLPVIIELNLPNPAETVICTGCVVRSKRVRKGRWLTSFHFDQISDKARDIIAKNCFAEQRRQLRENIHT
ncbi:PilZ domain-containing protein [Desulfopila sp. IMCC35006]|uniref:PilZ domain-containing protein n=1 Tax=Desulfopila sp. IMCC35006 TaxID=2569542 RepID=UPI0010AB5A41|nr:PilZ domain-containing protein [Desulfopila sp. IMCC35006]TKB25837.1 PilZ domain-containing protein [Desulfopila sp. IMCC35006]